MESITISRDDVTQAVRKQMKSDTCELINYTIQPASENPMGFLGDHLRVKGRTKYDEKEEDFQYFVKLIPTKVQLHREYAEKTRAFFKEIEMYKTLFEDMKNALKSERRSLKWRPESFFTRDWEVLLVEDLSLQGFYMLPERMLMEVDHVEATIKALAKMNAGTFILEAKLRTGETTTLSTNYHPEKTVVTVKELYPQLIFESECTNEAGHPGFKFWETGIQSQLAIIDLLPNYTPSQKEIIKKRFPSVMTEVYAMALPSTKYKNVITHADLWGNNILFKNGPDGKVAQAILVDFQMARYAPPAQDLLVLLHIVQKRDFRRKYEEQLRRLYYESLSSELNAEGLNIEDFLPKAEFDESLILYKKFAILTSIIYTQLNRIPPDVSAKFLATTESYERVMFDNRSDLLVEVFHNDELSRALLIETIEELVDVYNILQK